MKSEYKKSEWNPYKSKWKAALEKKLIANLNGDENILYLGASSGTTIKHLAPQTSGIIFGVEKSATMAIPLVKLSINSKNIAPVFADAHDTDYIKKHLFEKNPDILFQDIPSRDQLEILQKTSKLIDKNCKIFLSLKTQSISQQDWKKTVFETKQKLEKDFVIKKSGTLEPFHKKHYFFMLQKK